MVKSKNTPKKLEIYDTTLRDGCQAEGIQFSTPDKIEFTQILDDFGIAYIEGGWPGSNPSAIAYFKEIQKVELKNIKVAAFGSTRRAKISPAKDPNIKALLDANVPVVTIFGKSWDMHVTDALRVPLKENLKMIEESVSYLLSKKKEVVYDAEHFFDGFKKNKDYAIETIAAAIKGGAKTLALCDTNGGTLPLEIESILIEIKSEFPNSNFGIHAHNDSGVAIANTLTAINCGSSHIQGVMNGFGERCGNVNLITVIAITALKMGIKSIKPSKIKKLQYLSKIVDEFANQENDKRAPFIGASAFAHKGGIHVSAVQRNSACYEHIDPALVGNRQRILLSEQSGRSNIHQIAESAGINLKKHEGLDKLLLKRIKELEETGYEFEGALASFELIMDDLLEKRQHYFEPKGFRVIGENRDNNSIAEATVKVSVNGTEHLAVSEGNGPVNALDQALRNALRPFFPGIDKIYLQDYKVRVFSQKRATASRVRVLITSKIKGENSWSTVGVSEDIIEASWEALLDSISYAFKKYKHLILKK
ncbi:MAG: citramalate synthase [Planctomycetota bacterium]|nr:MAG: citramalate synthase [Planctomycetota bacterium]